MKNRRSGVLETKRDHGPRQNSHRQALLASSFLTDVYRRMYQPMAARVAPKKVVTALRQAGVIGLLLGTHGIGGYRSEPRATQDVDVLIKRKDHAKAVRAIRQQFPKLEMQDTPAVTRFLDPHNGKPVVELLKPTSALFKAAFRFALPVGDTHCIPDLEFALVSKFAAMMSPNRGQAKKLIDAGDFVDMVTHNLPNIDEEKLRDLANKVYSKGGVEISQLVRDVEAGRPIRI